MKRTMDEYKISMDRIVPSEIFLSETEALMKKIRDENASKEIMTNPEETNKTEDISIDIRTNIRTARIKKWTIGMSAVAAAVVCVFAIGSSRSMDVKESMVTEPSSDVVSETLQEADEMAVTTAYAAEAEETTALPAEEISYAEENAAETEAPKADEKDIRTKEEKKKNERKTEEKAPAADEKPAGGDLNTANSVNGEKHAVIADDTVDAGVTEIIVSEDIVSETTENVGLLSDDAPVYYPYYGDTEEVDIDDDESFEEETPSVYGGYSPSQSAPVVFFALSESDEVYFGTEDIYVPDSISEMSDGGYYLVIDAGFDRYTVSGSETESVLVGAASKEVRDETEASDLLSSIAAISEECTAVFSEKEQVMTNFRYSVKVCSSDAKDRDAELFEIRFDRKVLQINRYDNGTVSSEIYYLGESEYNELNKLVEKTM